MKIRMLVLILALTLVAGPALAWDSRTDAGLQIGLGMHYQFTSVAIALLGDAELKTYRDAIISGSLTELHELPSKKIDVSEGNKYGIDVEALRKKHKGTNPGCDDIEGWWKDAVEAYKAGKRDRAWFIVGIILHMVQDMGVPSHARDIYHQGTLAEMDKFEFNATFNASYVTTGPPFYASRLDMGRIDKTDPAFAEPWQYYHFNKFWAFDDSPMVRGRNYMELFRVWPFYTDEMSNLMQNRQHRTCIVSKWMLSSALAAFKKL